MLKRIALLLAIGLFAFGAAPAEAQFNTTVGFGWATPQSDLDDRFNDGYTVRGAVGLSALGLVELDAVGGWTHFDRDGEGGNRNTLHAGVGGRVGLGLIFVGANGIFLFGDGPERVSILPEIGVRLALFEVVADYNFASGHEWFSLRAGIRF